MAWYNWSQTSASNATADPTINWQEGQAPSSINDSARAMMSATAKYRDDIAGAIVTAGTSTAYTLSSFSVYDTLAHLNGQMIAFSPHVTNGAGPVTLNVDGLGAFPIQPAPGVLLPSGTIIQGTPYVVTYNNTAQAFYLHGFYGNPYNVPIGASLDFWGTTGTPNSSFAFPYGQAISRTVYSTLFSILSTSWGAGDGSTTFNLPDLRGRVVAAADNLGGSAAGRLLANSSLSSGYYGGVGGETSHGLAASEIPTISTSVSGSINSSTINGNSSTAIVTVPSTGNLSYGNYNLGVGSVTVPTSTSGNFGAAPASYIEANLTASGNSTNTGNATHNNIQPTIVANCIMRII